MTRNAVTAAAALCLIAALSLFADPRAVQAESTILTGKIMNLVTRSPTTHFHGILEEILVQPGQRVQEGEPLLKYSLQEDQRRALQKEVDSGPGIEGMESQIADLERELAQVEAQRNKARSLASSGLGSRQASNRLDQDVSAINRRIALTRRSIDKAKHNFDVRMKELAGYFNQDISEGMELPRYLYLKAPIAGYVLSTASLGQGSQIGAGFSPCLIGQMDPLLISVPVYEGDIGAVKVGDKAVVQIPSLQDRKFEATVKDIDWISSDMNVASASYYTVKLTIPNPDLLLKPGFKAVVRFGSR
ncbi:MAG: efflux RND transporter periplasmic adaptor subunit [Desulfovibrio sp.]|nr:efflux RND transporter periplasmic adaptor subunit [Desulfovibrio sp.]